MMKLDRSIGRSETWRNEVPSHVIDKFPYVSVVIPTYNRSESLKECLNALLSLNYPKGRLEIIVVDDASNDETPRILSEYRKKGIIAITHNWNTGPAGARNSGIKQARGDIIAFVDDDELVSRNWLRELVKPYEDPTVAGVGGSILPKKEDRSIQHRSARSLFEIYNYARGWKQATFLANLQSKIFSWKSPESKGEIAFYAYQPTGNISYRKRILLEVGGFDEKLLSGEDFSLKMKVAKKGYKVTYANKAVVLHSRRRSFKHFLIDCIYRGMGRAAFLNKYRWRILPWLLRGRKVILLMPVTILMAVILFITLEPSMLLTCLLGGVVLYELIEAARLSLYAKNPLLTPAFFVLDCLRKILLGVGFVKGTVLLFTRSSKKAKLTKFRKGLPSD